MKKIRIDDDVYKKLTELKGKQSYSTYLEKIFNKKRKLKRKWVVISDEQIAKDVREDRAR